MKKKISFILLVLAVLFVIFILLPIDICIILWKILLICLFSYALYKCVNLAFSLLHKDGTPHWYKEKKIKIILGILSVIISIGIVTLSDTINYGFEEFKRGYDSVRDNPSIDDSSHDSGDRGSFQTSDQESSQPSDPEQLYAPVLEKYTTALAQGYDMGQLRDAGLNYLCAYSDDISKIGYALVDIDRNGTMELMIGEIEGGDYFFDLYIIAEGTPILVAQSAERDRYYLCADGVIANEGSSSAFSSSTAYYMVGEQGQLILSEAVIHDEEYSSDGLWYSTSAISAEGASPLSRESADLIYKKHEYVTIDYTSFFPR